MPRHICIKSKDRLDGWNYNWIPIATDDSPYARMVKEIEEKEKFVQQYYLANQEQFADVRTLQGQMRMEDSTGVHGGSFVLHSNTHAREHIIRHLVRAFLVLARAINEGHFNVNTLLTVSLKVDSNWKVYCNRVKLDMSDSIYLVDVLKNIQRSFKRSHCMHYSLKFKSHVASYLSQLREFQKTKPFDSPLRTTTEQIDDYYKSMEISQEEQSIAELREMSFDDLPDNVIKKIFKKLENRVDIANFRLCSKRCQKIAEAKVKEWSKYVWNELRFCDFGRGFKLSGSVNQRNFEFIYRMSDSNEMNELIYRRLAGTIVDQLSIDTKEVPLEFQLTDKHLKALADLKAKAGFELNTFTYLPELYNYNKKCLSLESDLYEILAPTRISLKQHFQSTPVNYDLKIPRSVESISGFFKQVLDFSEAENLEYVEVFSSSLSLITSIIQDGTMESLMRRSSNPIKLVMSGSSVNHVIAKYKMAEQVELGYWRIRESKVSSMSWVIFDWEHPRQHFTIELYVQTLENSFNYWHIRHGIVKPIRGGSAEKWLESNEESGSDA
ncbi:unnamed protein product, partial [Mesorhabditis belari]|uniref:F-box domain-containing protein n=1 Tax=Mesorhabditis belari TaxID=2138241 RepID=A0AAF3EQV3_9BILA